MCRGRVSGRFLFSIKKMCIIYGCPKFKVDDKGSRISVRGVEGDGRLGGNIQPGSDGSGRGHSCGIVCHNLALLYLNFYQCSKGNELYQSGVWFVFICLTYCNLIKQNLPNPQLFTGVSPQTPPVHEIFNKIPLSSSSYFRPKIAYINDAGFKT